MIKVYKLTMMVVDLEDMGLDEIRERVESGCGVVVHQDSRDIGEWSDDHPLNNADTYQAEFDRLFGDAK